MEFITAFATFWAKGILGICLVWVILGGTFAFVEYLNKEN